MLTGLAMGGQHLSYVVTRNITSEGHYDIELKFVKFKTMAGKQDGAQFHYINLKWPEVTFRALYRKNSFINCKWTFHSSFLPNITARRSNSFLFWGHYLTLSMGLKI